jgi:hypothetical protein
MINNLLKSILILNPLNTLNKPMTNDKSDNFDLLRRSVTDAQSQAALK